MTASRIDDLVELHRSFWARGAEKPIINIDCSTARRFRNVPAIPPQWESRDGLLLEPDMLQPEQCQPAPLPASDESPLCGEVAFNAIYPFNRVPWLAGIMGCGLKVSATSQTVWPVPYLPDDWHARADLGFAPCLEWLDKLLEFLEYLVKNYYPHSCVPCPDMIARGPGDLCLAVMGAEKFYVAMYDHPDELRELLHRITDIYIRWGRAQIPLLPRIKGGYVNQYGIWCPGTVLRFQEDYAVNLSPELFAEFLKPGLTRVANAFDYQVFHTHSAFPLLSEWMLDVEELAAIEVVLDPIGPELHECTPLWRRILEKKALFILGPLTERQLDLIVESLPHSRLVLDIEVVLEEELEQTWEWDWRKKRAAGR